MGARRGRQISLCILFIFWQSVFLTAESCRACLVQISSIVGVHNCMDSHVWHIVEVLMLHKRIVGGCIHLAHVRSLLAEDGRLLASHAKVTALLAVKDRRVPPLESFHTRGVAHATIIVSAISQLRRHIFLKLIIIKTD